MQQDHVLNKLNFDLITPRVGWGVCRQNICYHFAAFVIYLNLICNMFMFWKSCKVVFWHLDPQCWRGGGGGVCWQNIPYYVAACVIPFNLICNMTIFWRSWFLSFRPHHLSPPRGSDRCLWSKITFDMFHNIFTSFCMRQFSKKCWQLTELL